MARLTNTNKALLGGCLTGLKGGVKEGKEENLQPLVCDVTAILVPQVVGKDRELCITSESDNYEVFGAPVRAKRTAHLSGQIANCLRPLGRVFAI